VGDTGRQNACKQSTLFARNRAILTAKLVRFAAPSWVKKYGQKAQGLLRSWRVALQDPLLNKVSCNAVKKQVLNAMKMQAS
jgi:hypothetical protein